MSFEENLKKNNIFYYIMSDNIDLNKNGHVFIPGHPMAGTEHVGFASSTDSIFTNSSYILIQTKDIVKNIIAN